MRFMNDAVAQAALDRAVDDTERLLLLYQPIHDATSGEVYAAEALLRQRRESGEIREASIISSAAESSAGPELFVLDSVLVRRAYTEALVWQKAASHLVRLNVNLSPREFQEGDVLGRLNELMTSCGVDPHTVNLEITETSYIERPRETMHVLAELRELGLSLWLDDFGTGHSSITHLQHFPLNGIKLPGAFVRELPDDRRCRSIVHSLISLAHDLGLAVIAEEVERKEQLDLLREEGCEYIQGFYFNRPMSATDLATLLRGGR